MPPKLRRPAAKAAPKAGAKAKAKAGARAKAKAAPKAGLGVRLPRLRRPAARGAGQGPAVEEKILKDLGVGELQGQDVIWLKRAFYYQREVDLVIEVQGIKQEDGKTYVEGKILGTKDEDLLRTMTAREDRLVKVHVCPHDCDGLVSGENLIHGWKFEKVARDAIPWFTNLQHVVGREGEEEDELQKLREASKRDGDPGESGKTPKTKEKKEKKKKKKKEKASSSDENQGGKEKKKKEKDKDDTLERGQKKVRSLFQGTGLDPDPTGRGKILKKAKRIGQKKKKKKKKSSSDGSGTGTTSSTEGSSDEEEGGGLYSSEKKIKLIWDRCPGALTAVMLQEARNCLLTGSGSLWDVDQSQLPPLVGQYIRASMHGNMSPPMYQEAVTLGLICDLLLRGHAAKAADVASQRLKSLEGTSRGAHWTVGRQLELAKSELMSITDPVENLEAARRAKEEEKLKSLTSRPSGNRGGEGGGYNYGKGKNKGGNDFRSAGKGRHGETPKGGKGDGKKDDKGGWQSKQKS